MRRSRTWPCKLTRVVILFLKRVSVRQEGRVEETRSVRGVRGRNELAAQILPGLRQTASTVRHPQVSSALLQTFPSVLRGNASYATQLLRWALKRMFYLCLQPAGGRRHHAVLWATLQGNSQQIQLWPGEGFFSLSCHHYLCHSTSDLRNRNLLLTLLIVCQKHLKEKKSSGLRRSKLFSGLAAPVPRLEVQIKPTFLIMSSSVKAQAVSPTCCPNMLLTRSSQSE